MRKLPPLNALPAFEATARLGSVTAAADELGRTHSAISKQLKHLSEDLGVALFEKDGVGLRLTAEGARLREICTALLDQLEAGCRSIRPDHNPNRLRIGVSATFAMRWLTPRMPAFYARHPGVEIEIKMAGRAPIPAEDVDAVLTWDRLNWAFQGERLPKPAIGCRAATDMLKRRLGDVAFGVVCAPDFPITRQGDRLEAQVGIMIEGGPRSWSSWAELTGIEVALETTISYPHTFLGLEAAIAGMGAMVTVRHLVEKDLAEGRLTAPVGFHTIKNGLGAHISPQSARRKIVIEFLDWIEHEAHAA